MNILVVEDSATLRFAMQNFIGEAGHRCVLAENGEKAVQMVDPLETHLIIMDVEMPGLNGFETTRLIRESLGENWVPIIFITGKNEEGSFSEGINAGGDDYLIKPVSKAILHAKIAAIERIINMRNQLRDLNKELVKLSQTDSLTSLLNRRSFEEKARDAWRRAKRSRRPLSVLLLDIDYFKQYNDRYGHPAGDKCIQAIAHTLKSCCGRVGDLVARYGGEEFIVLLPNTDAQGAEYIARQILTEIIKLNIEHKESELYNCVTISIGGATLDFVTGIKLESAIKTADMALYESKNKGKNCVHIWVMNNVHPVLIIAHNEPKVDLENALVGHCDSVLVRNKNDIKLLLPFKKPSLVIVYADHALDESVLLYHRLKYDSSIGRVPLVVYTRLDRDASRELVSELGADCVLQRSSSTDQAVAKIADLLGAEASTIT